jgi:hypothetical protein
MRYTVGVVVAVLAASPPASLAQEEPASTFARPPQGGLEAIIHRDTFFTGPFVSVTGPTPNLNLGWDARSIRVRSGEWQICTGRNYTGRCTTLDRDMPTLTGQFRTIESMRPTGGFGTGVGQSLRGASSEFFPAPLRNGQRIECTGGGNSSCARSEANSFCRSVGWVMSRTQTTETVDRRSVVADVLCSRTPF